MLVGSRRERLEVLHIVPVAGHHIVPVEVLHNLAGEVHRDVLVAEEGVHSLAEEARRIAGAVQVALHIVPGVVLEEEARRNVLVVVEGGHILVEEVVRRIAGVDLAVVGHSPVEEGDHRNRPVGADRRSSQTCLLV